MKNPVKSLLVLAGLTIASAAASEQQGSGAIDRFARGLVTLARQEQARNAVAFARLTGVPLRNPNKWDDQSEEGRTATWRDLRNRVGVSQVTFSEYARGFSADLDLTGTPCIRITQLESAAGMKASRGLIGFPTVYDGPPAPPIELGEEHVALYVEGRSGVVTSIVMQASDPSPGGCIQWLSLQSSRNRPGG